MCTGGGSGIGRAVVAAFVAAGANVAVLELDPAKCGALSDFGDAVVAVPGDATTREDNESLVAVAIERWGRIDVAVTFVGVFDLYTPLAEIPDDRFDAAFDEVFGLNVKSPLLTARAALAALREATRFDHLHAVELQLLRRARRTAVRRLEVRAPRARRPAGPRTGARRARERCRARRNRRHRPARPAQPRPRRRTAR